MLKERVYRAEKETKIDASGLNRNQKVAVSDQPETCIVVVTPVRAGQPTLAHDADGGGQRYLLRDTSSADLHQLLMQAQGSASRTQAHNGAESLLTPRETEVLQLASRGYTNAEISQLLGVSTHTVNSHQKNAYRKLAVKSRSEAVFEAIRLGIINIG